MSHNPTELQKAFAIRLEEKQVKIKENIAQHMKDSEMMAKMLDVVGHFQKLALDDTDVKQMFQYYGMGIAALHDKRFRFTSEFGTAIKALTHPARLSRISDVRGNMFDFSYLTQQVETMVEKLRRQRDGEDTEDEGEVDELEKELRIGHDVLDFLLTVYDMLRAMPPTFFTEALTEDQKTSMEFEVAKAAFSMKVFGFNSNVKDVQRIAFVGCQGVGKSTFINYLTSQGRSGDDFMYVSSGMGTQVPCIISHGPQEKLSLKAQGPTTLDEVYANIRRESMHHEENLQTGKISGIEAFLATRPFNPPINVELVDVPGIRAETKLETVLALSICTTVALCLPEIKDAHLELEHGNLKLLTEITKELPRGFHLIGLVTQNVPQGMFRSLKKSYEALLTAHFPTAKQPISVIYANFAEMKVYNKLQQGTEDFYKVLGKHVDAKLRDPYSIVKDLASPLQAFLGKVSFKLCTEMKSYTDSFEGVLGTLRNNQRQNRTKTYTMEDVAMPELENMLNNCSCEIADAVFVHEELLIETTLALGDWLKKQGKSLHGHAFGQGFDNLSEIWYPQQRDEEARVEVCDGLCLASEHRYLQLKTRMLSTSNTVSQTKESWISKYVTGIGTFVQWQHFPWIITGSYLLVPYSQNKHLLFDEFHLRGESTDADAEADSAKRGWAVDCNLGLAQTLEAAKVSASTWVEQCRAKDSVKDVHDEIFNCMELSCQECQSIINEKGFVHWSKPLEELLDMCFRMLMRLIVKKPWDRDLEYTSFAQHLQNTKHDVLQLRKLQDKLRQSSCERKKGKDGIQQGMGLSENSVEPAVLNHCAGAIALLRKAGADKQLKWDTQITDLEMDLKTMAQLKEEIDSGFCGDAAPSVLIIQNQAIGSTTQGALAEIKNRFIVPSPIILEGVSPDACMARVLPAVRDCGSSVVVYARRSDTYSYDPCGPDIKILDQMRREPHIAILFVLWEPPHEDVDSPWGSPLTQKMWAEKAGEVHVRLVSLADAAAIRGFSEDVHTSLEGSAGEIHQRILNKRNDFQRRVTKFDAIIDDFLRASHGKCYGKEAKWFHKELIVNFRESKDRDVELASMSITGSASPIELKFPQGDFLASLPDFKVPLAAEGGSHIKELECRRFLCSVLLGQTMVKAREIASQLYDEVFTKILDKVGAWFQIDGKHLLKELDTFVRDGHMKDKEDKVGDFITKEHFAQMFVGLVLGNVIPLLECLVMPTIWDAASCKVSMASYESHLDAVLKKLLPESTMDMYKLGRQPTGSTRPTVSSGRSTVSSASCN